jgi:hypothetical protein
LKCCLNYELDTYLDALQGFPDRADTLQVARGTATLIKKDIFKNLMWYVLPESNKQYPLTIDRVRKIMAQNAQGIVPEELEPVDVTSTKIKEVEPEFVDVVGQISLRSLEKNDRRRKQQQKQKSSGQQKGAQQQVSGKGGHSQQSGHKSQQGGQGAAQSKQGAQQGGHSKQQGGQPKQQGGNRAQQPKQQQGGNKGPRAQQGGDRQPRQPKAQGPNQGSGQTPNQGSNQGQGRNPRQHPPQKNG